MTLRERNRKLVPAETDRGCTGDSKDENEILPVDDWERPESWERISMDDLPELEEDRYQYPDLEDLVEVSAEE